VTFNFLFHTKKEKKLKSYSETF